MPFRTHNVLQVLVVKEFLLVSGPTRPGPALVVFVSPMHEAANFLVDPWETFKGASRIKTK